MSTPGIEIRKQEDKVTLEPGVLESQGRKEDVLDIAPEGGLQAWLAAAGGACVFFCALGFANSFGVFEEYYLTHQLKNQSADNVAWIGSLASFLQFASGAVGGPLFDRYGSGVSLASC